VNEGGEKEQKKLNFIFFIHESFTECILCVQLGVCEYLRMNAFILFLHCRTKKDSVTSASTSLSAERAQRTFPSSSSSSLLPKNQHFFYFYSSDVIF
jgi:hypothetical protein